VPSNGTDKHARHQKTSGAVPVRRRPLRERVNAERQKQREKKRLRHFRAEVRRELMASNRRWSELRIAQEAERRWAKELAREEDHPHLLRELLRTMPSTVSVPRRDVHPLPELHAIRQLDIVKRIEQALVSPRTEVFAAAFADRRRGPWSTVEVAGGRFGRSGRPSTHRMSIALWETQVWLPGAPNLLRGWNELSRRDDCLHWALGWPWGGDTHHYGSTVEGMKSVLRHTDPTMLLAANLDAFRELRRTVGDDDLGRYCAIDGMFIPAAREQRETKTQLEEELINHGLEIDFGSPARATTVGLVTRSDHLRQIEPRARLAVATRQPARVP